VLKNRVCERGDAENRYYEKNKWLNNLLIIFKVLIKGGDLS